ncbi:MAG: PEP-CTERM sorting domain-containing protein, partial [Burkholderiales bacterium]|nr:PEP-CTERM sorting domain-containing protein [Burkholderiales bacterium]
MSMKKIAVAALLVASSFSANAAIEILGGKLYVAETGNVSVTFLGSDAGYNDVIFFNNAGFGQQLFSGHSTPVGTTLNLGSFAKGTELSFRMHVDNTGNNFYTGPASANFDNVLHAKAD